MNTELLMIDSREEKKAYNKGSSPSISEPGSEPTDCGHVVVILVVISASGEKINFDTIRKKED